MQKSHFIKFLPVSYECSRHLFVKTFTGSLRLFKHFKTISFLSFRLAFVELIHLFAWPVNMPQYYSVAARWFLGCNQVIKTTRKVLVHPVLQKVHWITPGFPELPQTLCILANSRQVTTFTIHTHKISCFIGSFVLVFLWHHPQFLLH